MKKALGSWGAMRKYLEQEIIAESLRGRVRYGCTSYIGMDGFHIFEICIDDVQVKRFSWETVNTYFINNGYKKVLRPMGIDDYWDNFHILLDEFPPESRTEYTDDEFCDALEEYRNQKIQASIHSENALVRMFAILDRRLGKRSLQKVKETITCQPEWLRYFYCLRIESELI